MVNRILGLVLSSALAGSVAQGQRIEPVTRVRPPAPAQTASDGRVTVVRLAPRYTTAIRMHEPVNSVALGDPASFSAEHSDQEPNLVFVKPITTQPARSNLLISTAGGYEASFLLVSMGELHAGEPPAIDFLLRYRPARRFLVEPASYPSALIAETAALANGQSEPEFPVNAGAGEPTERVRRSPDEAAVTLEDLLERQGNARLPVVYGAKPALPDPGQERVKAGVSEVIDQGREVVVLFSVVNPRRHSIELMPPQIQLGGKRKSRWVSAEQYPILDYRLSRRRLGPGERADGVVVFDRPPYKQSNETLFLQIAESGAVDRPALAPIGFGVSNFDFDREGGSHGEPPGD